MLKFLGVVAALAGLAYLGGGWYFSSQLIAQPARPFPTEVGPLLAAESLPIDPETFSVVSDGLTIEGWYFEGTADCGLVFLHGYGGNRTSMVPFVGEFADLGCHMVAYDARGHGLSDQALHTFGAHERNDGAVVVEWLARRVPLGLGDIGVIGVSYGGAGALGMLPILPDLAFVVANSPYSSMRDIATYQGVVQFGDIVLPFADAAILISEARARFDEDDAAPVRSVVGTRTPALLLHEAGDDYIPVAQARAIDAADPDDGVVYVEIDAGGGHATMFSDDRDGYRAIVDDFLAEYAPDFGS